MCRVIAVSNQKGGVGKTVSCVNLGIGLAQEGKKVLLIDADPQGSLTISLGYEEPDEMEYSLATLMLNVVNDEKLNMEKTILHHGEGVDLIPRAYGLPKNLPGEEKKAAGKEAQNYDNRIPGVSIHYKDAIELVTSGASQACLSVEQETVTRTSRNVVARIEGTDRAEEILTLTAHYDSVPEGPGAYDNMSGGAIIMELCRYFQVHRPRRTMEFVWFGAEEKGLLGSQSYIKVHETELPAHRFNMNVDLAGQLVGGTVVGVTGDASVCNMITYMAHEIGIGMSTKNQIWGSDSNTFAWKGIPAMTLNRDGFGMHTRHDTIALLSDWSLERSAILLGYIADRLGNIDSFPFERKVPEEFITQLDEYFG